MTAQEIFDKVWHHMASQKVKSLNANGCAYRGKNGTACAVGCLLDDETAHKFDNMDNPSILDIAQKYMDMIPENPTHTFGIATPQSHNFHFRFRFNAVGNAVFPFNTTIS